MGAQISASPAAEASSASVSSLVGGKCFLDIQIAEMRVVLFGDDAHAAGLRQMAEIFNQTFGARPVAEMPREPANPDDVEF